MDILTLFLLALGLSMDAFAVSISNGLCYKHQKANYTLATALAFGLAQGIMPIIGYLCGQTFSHIIVSYDHWVALILLGLIGGKMIFEGIKGLSSKEESVAKPFSFHLLFVQAIATSIDALAVGISLALIKVNIFMAASFIGVVTFILSLIGVLIGKRFGSLFKQQAEILGGIILVGIGFKIFFEHMLP